MLREYQDSVEKAVHRQGTGYWPPLVILARLAEEVGEAADKLTYEHNNRPAAEDDVYGEKEGPFFAFARALTSIGELARELNHRHGPKKRRPAFEAKEPSSLEDELGDIVFTAICMANSRKLDLDRGLMNAIAKCDGRDKDRFKQVTK